MLPRLDEIEAVAEGWVGEVEGVDLTLDGLRGKRDLTLRLAGRGEVDLGLPFVPAVATRPAAAAAGPAAAAAASAVAGSGKRGGAAAVVQAEEHDREDGYDRLGRSRPRRRSGSGGAAAPAVSTPTPTSTGNAQHATTTSTADSAARLDGRGSSNGGWISNGPTTAGGAPTSILGVLGGLVRLLGSP